MNLTINLMVLLTILFDLPLVFLRADDGFEPVSVGYLTLNNYTEFPESSVKELYGDIKGVSIENCKLPREPLAYLRELKKLKEITMKSNGIKNLSIKQYNFKYPQLVKPLVKLHVEKEDIKTLVNETFSAFENLRTLTLKCLNLQTIEKNAFKGLDDLEYLDLSHNHIQNFAIDVFEPLKNLRILNLNNNLLENQDVFAGTHMPNLMTLEMENNPIKIFNRTALKTAAPNLKNLKFCKGILEKCDIKQTVC